MRQKVNATGRALRRWGVWCAVAAAMAFMDVAPAEEREFQAIPAALPFTGYVLTDGLDFPWEMLWGPDNMLWVTERHGRKITRVNPNTGEKKTLAVINDAYPGPQHEGVLGMAFGPGFMNGGRNDVFVYYTCKENGSEKRWGRLVRFSYNRERDVLENPQTLLDGIPAGDDHNAGRVRYGPDGKLYLSLGEQGHNQGKNTCLPIEAQRIPTIAEVEGKDWDAYRGKVLRINPDGSIPSDNPVIKGVKSHIFTYGHRNPQGLAFVGNLLYSCEHGPSSDDELNLLEAGGNYGWPHVAGFRDGQGYEYANYSAASNCQSLASDPDVVPEGVPVQHEMEWYDPNFKAPVKTFYTVRNDHNFHDPKCLPDNTYLCYPTIAPADVVYYPRNGVIPGWGGSLLIATLKTGALFQIALSGDNNVQGDYTKYFRSRNRYRVVATDPEGRRIFIACDNSGGAKDDEGRPAANVRNPGAILVFVYNADGGYGYSPSSGSQVRIDVSTGLPAALRQDAARAVEGAHGAAAALREAGANMTREARELDDAVAEEGRRLGEEVRETGRAAGQKALDAIEEGKDIL